MGDAPMLVAYSDSDDEVEAGADRTAQDSGTSKRKSSKAADQVDGSSKRRKLPPLVLPTTSDALADESQSQRRPTGDWVCHVFLEVSDRADLGASLAKAKKTARGCEPQLQDVQPRAGESGLHISLTRPVLVRPHERKDFVTVARDALKGAHGLLVSFACFTSLVNEDESRAFLAVELAAGHDALSSLSERLDSRLRDAFKAKPYYDKKRYHFSFVHAEMPAAQDASLALIGRVREAAAMIEREHGPDLRALPPLRLSRLGIRVGKEVTWLSLPVA